MSKNRSNRLNEDGNTNPRPKKQPAKANRWCFTWNNYPEDGYQLLVDTFTILECKWIVGKEIGKLCKTPHFQGYIECPTYMRWTEFKLPKTIHWEKAKGDLKQNLTYCSKDGSYNCIDVWNKYLVPIKCIDKLFLWQQKIEADIILEPDGRTIKWIWDRDGNTGKSSFCKYMYIKHGVPTIQGGKMSDIINIIYNLDMHVVRMVLIDIPRCNENKVSYSAIECILNGMITNTKFETGLKVFNPPHIVVLANFPPREEKLSADRWKIYKIKNKDLLAKP